MKGSSILSSIEISTILTAIIVGTLARAITLKQDFRQYPTYPNASVINMVIGFIASALGAVAIPALISKDFTAITFLSLAIQQFREVRKLEKSSLQDLEKTQFTERGEAYIDGIAKTFEVRNYISLLVALTTSLTIQLVKTKIFWLNICAGIIMGFLVLHILRTFTKGKTVGDIAEVKPGNILVKGTELYVDDIFVSNILGNDRAQNLYEKEGMAVVVHPKEKRYRLSLENYGQRQAMLFEATRALGVKRYNFTRKDYKEGRIVVTLVPILADETKLIEAVKNTPILETVKKVQKLMQTNYMGGVNNG